MRIHFDPAWRSRVALRLVALFVLCAALPLCALAILTVYQTSRSVEERTQEQLRYEARAVGQEGLGRLDALARNLMVVAQSALTADGTARLESVSAGLLNPMPDAVSVTVDRRTWIPVSGALTPGALSDDDRRHLDAWGRLIVPNPNDAARLVLIVEAAASDGRTAHAAASLNLRELFALNDEEARPPDSDICVVAGPGLPQCSTATLEAIAREALSPSAASTTTLVSANGPQLARAFFMPLQGQYATPEWAVVATHSLASVRAPTVRFLNNVWLTALLGLLVAAWLGITQVRRQIKPLEQLTAATARVAHRGFERIELHSRDEFQTLGDAFNTMSSQLRDQFDELEAFSIGSLSALARAIDAKSPWTAGHSERVTAYAVAIANEMRLPPQQIDELRRGGLVHDIGKLATPAEILDKPARLTAEEERIMRLHPMQGVHILEPIPAFAPLLDIVGQHHEKWDGSGYPHQLAGEAISRTARVLAVADVYDAIRSDRPYRAGMSVSTVIHIISSGAGKAFDPEVVEAFMTIASTLDDCAQRMTTGSIGRAGADPAATHERGAA